MTAMASQITNLTIVYSTVYSGRSKKTSHVCICLFLEMMDIHNAMLLMVNLD